MENRIYLFGVDPSFTNFGVSLYDPKTKTILKMKTGEFLPMVNWIGQNIKLKTIIAVVENPDMDKNIFGMWGMVKSEIDNAIRYAIWRAVKFGMPQKWASRILLGVGVTKKSCTTLSTETNLASAQQAFGIAMKRARSVGENSAAAKLIIKMLADKNVPIIQISPSKRDRFDRIQKKFPKVAVKLASLKMPTKTSAQAFNGWTGWTERSNEHNRDAGTLVYNKTMLWARAKLLENGYFEDKPDSYPAIHNDNFKLVDRKKAVE